jgi:hypothetical protein
MSYDPTTMLNLVDNAVAALNDLVIYVVQKDIENEAPEWAVKAITEADTLINGVQDGLRDPRHYIVAWTGGYEEPQFAFRAIKAEAIALAQEWDDDAGQGETNIDVLEVAPAAGTVTLVEGWAVQRSKDWTAKR